MSESMNSTTNTSSSMYHNNGDAYHYGNTNSRSVDSGGNSKWMNIARAVAEGVQQSQSNRHSRHGYR